MEGVGLCRYTGKILRPTERLKQAIFDILTTPKGSRILNRAFGSNLYQMIDQNLDPLSMSYEIADSIGRCEPTFKVKRVLVSTVDKAGKVAVMVSGVFGSEKKDYSFEI
jgi:phage baseplate assembly protein W